MWELEVTAAESSRSAPLSLGSGRRSRLRRSWRRWLQGTAVAVADGGDGCEGGVSACYGVSGGYGSGCGCWWQHVEAGKGSGGGERGDRERVRTRCRRLETDNGDCERRHGRPRAASRGAWQTAAFGRHGSSGRSARRIARRVEARSVAVKVSTLRGGAAGSGGGRLGVRRCGWRQEACLARGAASSEG